MFRGKQAMNGEGQTGGAPLVLGDLCLVLSAGRF